MRHDSYPYRPRRKPSPRRNPRRDRRQEGPASSEGFGAWFWTSTAVASACHEIQVLAPALGNLLCDPAVPEPSLKALLDWAVVAADPASTRAFDLSSLAHVLPAMVRAFIASHHYRLERAEDQGRTSERLIMSDTGSGALVGRVMMLLTEVIAAAHGPAGRKFARESRSDLARHFAREIDRIKRR